MKPIYFPFTYIPKTVVDALSLCFQQTVIYQPAHFTVSDSLHNWSREGELEIRIPVEGDEARLVEILKDYRQWAKLHLDSRGLQNAFTRKLFETVPFFDETSTSRIKADIQKQEQENQRSGDVGPDIGARIFLAIAQEFDMEGDRLRDELSIIDAMEYNLMADLHGRRQHNDQPPARHNKRLFSPGDAFEYMIPERFMAWYRIMQSDRELERDSSGLFVTSNQRALDYLLDGVSRTEKILTIDAIPVYAQRSAEIDAWRNHLRDQLQKLPATALSKPAVNVAAAPTPENCTLSASLTLYRVPGESPRSLFSRSTGQAFPPAGNDKRESGIENTFVGCVSL
jgi:hypothetical protein